MMINNDLEIKIKNMVQNELVASEIIKRLILLQKPVDFEDQIVSILDNLDQSEEINDQILKCLKQKMANYDHGMCGADIASFIVRIPMALYAMLNGKSMNGLRDPINRIELEALTLALSGSDAAKSFKGLYDNALDFLNNTKCTKRPGQILKIETPIIPEKPVVKRIYFRSTNRSDLF